MPYIYNKTDIKEKRVKIFIDTLHRSFTNLMLLDKQASELIDVEAEKKYIANRSYVDAGDSIPVLPLGNELVFQFNSLGLNFDSESKFIVEKPEGTELRNVLDVAFVEEGESVPEDTSVLNNGLKIRDGEIIFRSLERYDYDYKSYEILNEMYRALEIFFASVESFFARYYYDQYEDTDRSVIVYDTADIDEELETVIFPIADTITNAVHREEVKTKYRELRDRIKFFCMDIVLKIDDEIDKLLYCINGSKKYSIIQNIETKQLEMLIDENGKYRRVSKDEEVFFPFHNKPTLNEFTLGIQSVY